MPKRSAKLLIFSLGLLLGLLQMGYVLSVQRMLSSTITSYLCILAAWLIGGIVGVNLRQLRPLYVPVALALGAYYVSQLLLQLAPFQMGLMPIHCALSATGGLLGGAGFRIGCSWFAEVRDMFFHENNGFLLGLVGAFVGTSLHGYVFLLIAPVGLVGMSAVGWFLLANRPIP